MAEESRKWLFRIHAWVGFNLGFLLFVVCFSGTVAVFSADLNWLADPALRVERPTGAERKTMSWQEMHDRVASAYPQALILYLSAPRGQRSVARATIASSPVAVGRVLIDPYTGALQGHKSGFNLESFFRIFHKQLYIVPSTHRMHGTLIVGALSILLLAGAITGLLSIKRWWRAFLTLRRGRSQRLFWSDLHRLAGVWPLIVTVVLSLTGIWYLTERVLLDAKVMVEDAPPIRLSRGDLRDRPAVLKPLDLDRAAALAEATYPGFTIHQIALPRRAGDPLTFTGQAEAWVVRDRANQVQMDPYSGKILNVQRAPDLGLFERWIDTADPLHFGTFAGTTSQVLWFAAGLMLCAGILAGLYGAWLRLEQNGASLRKRRPLAAAAAILPTAVLLLASVYGAWAYGGEPLRSAQRPVSVTPLLQSDVGPWKISIARLDAATAAPGLVNLRVLFEDEGRPNFERVVLRIGDVEVRRTTRFVDRLVAQVTCPHDPCRVTLSIREWNGTEHAVSVDLLPRAMDAQSLPVATGISSGEMAVIALFVLCLLLPFLGWVRLQVR